MSSAAGETDARPTPPPAAPVQRPTASGERPDGARSGADLEGQGCHLRTASWCGDRTLHLPIPADWEVETLWPRTPAPLSEQELQLALESPVNRPSLAELLRAATRPLLLVDDHNRPTPAFAILPILLRQLEAAGLPPHRLRILVASGAHAAPTREMMAAKVGAEAAARCVLLAHDPYAGLVHLGTTRSGTPILVNREVVTSDLVFGIGGIYPNHTAGFGGGSKLALGVLGAGSILALHSRHKSCGWGSSAMSSFREELDEISHRIGLDFLITLQIDADRNVVRIRCGDHYRYYPEELAFARATFAVRLPEEADLVISNAYPIDASLTFVHAKGAASVLGLRDGVSRVVIAACSEGLGFHGLFPRFNTPRLQGLRVASWKSLLKVPPGLRRQVEHGLHRLLFARHRPGAPGRGVGAGGKGVERPLWLYRTEPDGPALPPSISGLRVCSAWSDILAGVSREQGGRQRLRAAVLPCAPLQFVEPRRQA